MSQRNVKTKHTYFAAANGYDGFRSYFPEVFCSDDFSRIYVIKGGPGTGKSSFMKKIENHFFDKGLKTEAIFCSSDISSLDGVIVENGEKRIAVLDGTAPHEFEAEYPGAVGEILNHADFWESKWLIGQGDKIAALSKSKRDAYKTAYKYMKVAGEAARLTDSAFKSYETSEAVSDITALCGTLGERGSGKIKKRLVSSFGKEGEKRLCGIEEEAKNKFSVVAPNAISRVIFKEIYECLLKKESDLTLLYSPYSADRIEGIYLPASETLILQNGPGKAMISIEEGAILSELEREKQRAAKKLHEDALAEARRWFAVASNIHAELEQIYKMTMNFDMLSEFYDKKISEMENILYNS